MKIWIRRSDSSEGSAMGIDLRSIINSATVNGVTDPDVSDLLIKCSEVIFVGLCRPSELFLSLGTSNPPKPISNRKSISALMQLAASEFGKVNNKQKEKTCDDGGDEDEDEETEDMKAFVLCPRPGSEDHFVGIASPTRRTSSPPRFSENYNNNTSASANSLSSSSPPLQQKQHGDSNANTSERPVWVDRANAGKHSGSLRSGLTSSSSSSNNNNNRAKSQENQQGRDGTPSAAKNSRSGSSNALPPLHKPSPVRKSSSVPSASRRSSPSPASKLQTSKKEHDHPKIEEKSRSPASSRSPQNNNSNGHKPMWGYSHVTAARKSTPVALRGSSSSPITANNDKSLHGISPIPGSNDTNNNSTKNTKKGSTSSSKKPTTSSRHLDNAAKLHHSKNPATSSVHSSSSRRSASSASTATTTGVPTREEMEKELNKSSQRVPDHLKAQARSSYLTRRQSQDRSQHNFTHQGHPLRHNVNLSAKKQEIDDDDLKFGDLSASKRIEQQQQPRDQTIDEHNSQPHFASKLQHPRMVRSSGHSSSRSVTPTPPPSQQQQQLNQNQNQQKNDHQDFSNSSNNHNASLSMNPSDLSFNNNNNNNHSEGPKTFHHVACDNFVPAWGMPRVCNTCKAQRRDHAKAVSATKVKQHQTLLNQRRNARNALGDNNNNNVNPVAVTSTKLYSIDGHRINNNNSNQVPSATVRVRSNERRGITNININNNNDKQKQKRTQHQDPTSTKPLIIGKIPQKRSTSNNSNKKIQIPTLNLPQKHLNNNNNNNHHHVPSNIAQQHQQQIEVTTTPQQQVVASHNNSSMISDSNHANHYYPVEEENDDHRRQHHEASEDAVYTDASESTRSSSNGDGHRHDDSEKTNHDQENENQPENQQQEQQSSGISVHNDQTQQQKRLVSASSSNGFLGSIARVSAALIEGGEDDTIAARNRSIGEFDPGNAEHGSTEEHQQKKEKHNENNNDDSTENGKTSFNESVVSDSAPSKYDTNVDWNDFAEQQIQQQEEQRKVIEQQQQKQKEEHEQQELEKAKKAEEEEKEEQKRLQEQRDQEEAIAEAERKRKLAHFSEF